MSIYDTAELIVKTLNEIVAADDCFDEYVMSFYIGKLKAYGEMLEKELGRTVEVK